jgi:hypothetical protein
MDSESELQLFVNCIEYSEAYITPAGVSRAI